MKQVQCRVSREETLNKMQAEIKAGVPVIISGAGAGIVGRVLESAGTDMAVVYNSGYFRINGHSSIIGNLPVGDANRIVYEMGRDLILPVCVQLERVESSEGAQPWRCL